MDRGRDHEVSVLNSLITTTIDSARGFERSAENVRGTQFERLFEEFASDRRKVVSALQDHVRSLGGTAEDDGSLKADLHRRFEDLRSALGGGDKAVIEEVERGEDYLKGKFIAALREQDLSGAVQEAINRAYQSVRAGHDEVSRIKHSFA